MERRKKKVTCLILSCFTLLLNISTVKAEALPEVMNGSATIADCVMSYYAMAGAAVANNQWIQTLYDGLGESFGTIYDFAENGLLTINNDGTWQATTALTDAIENSSVYTSLGLDDVFSISSAEAAAGGGVAAASGAATLSGAVGGVASSGVLPVLGGVTAAYWGGIAVGTLISHLTGLYGKTIYNGSNMTFSEAINSVVPNGYGSCTRSNGSKNIYFADGRMIVVGYYQNNIEEGYRTCRIIVQSNASSVKLYNYNYVSGNRSESDISVINGYAIGPTFGAYANYTVNPLQMFSDDSAMSSYISGLRNGSIDFPDITSPDMIGENGNLQAENQSGSGYTVPDMKPQIDSGTQSGVPLTMQDWLNFANSVKNNNSTTNPLPDNSALFDSLINRIVTSIPNPNPNPDPNPDPDPDPNPDPYNPPVVTPVPDPDYDPVPDNPDQPDYESEKQKQTEPIPDDIPTGAPWTTDGLLDKFPFCIPKDMIDMVKQFSSGSRQAPYINWTFNPPNTPVDYTFNLDLSDFEDAATLIRMLELAAFIVGLAFATRYLIGAS